MKSKNLFIYTILITICSLIIAGCNSSSSNNAQENGSKENETITLKFATYFATTSLLWSEVSLPWMEKVTELTNGKVKFETYPAEQLGKAHDLLQLTKDGVTDISVFPANYVPDNMPLTNMIAGLPNLSKTANQGTLAYNDLLKQNKKVLERDYLNNGITPLLQVVSPNYEIWTNEKELRVPEDFKGLKIRTPGGIANELYQSMGVVPVAISHTETYEALEKGVIDAVSYYSMAVENSGTMELLKYAVLPHIGTAIHGLTINNKVWGNLPEDVQKAMTQAGQEVMEHVGVMYVEKTNQFNDDFSKNGGIVVELTQKEQDKWDKVTEEFNKAWLKKNKSAKEPYEEVLNMYKENLQKYD